MSLEIQRPGPGNEPISETYGDHSYFVTDGGVLKIYTSGKESFPPVATYSPTGWLRIVEYDSELTAKARAEIEDLFN